MVIFIDILKFIILVLVTFATCKIITNDNKRISYIGTILICFSSAIVEYINSGLLEALIFSEGMFVSIDRLLSKSCYKYKCIFCIMLPIEILGFLLLSNISFQIPIATTTLTLFLWRILELKKFKEENLQENRKHINNKKINDKEHNNVLSKRFIVILLIGMILAIIIGFVFYKYKPIESIENRTGISYLTNYTYNSLIVFDRNIKYDNNSCLTTFISVFPIGLFIGIYYIFKEENKHINFIMPSVIISILELLLLVSNYKISFLPNYIFVLGFNLLQIYMIIYIFSRIEEKMFNLTKSAYISLIGLVFVMFCPIPSGLNGIFLNLSYIIFVLESYIVLNYSDKRFWRLASWVFTLICLIEFIGYIIVKIM